VADAWRRERERDGAPVSVAEHDWGAYVRRLEWEAWRARIRYDLLVLRAPS
jgi:hypothetical protein